MTRPPPSMGHRSGRWKPSVVSDITVPSSNVSKCQWRKLPAARANERLQKAVPGRRCVTAPRDHVGATASRGSRSWPQVIVKRLRKAGGS